MDSFTIKCLIGGYLFLGFIAILIARKFFLDGDSDGNIEETIEYGFLNLWILLFWPILLVFGVLVFAVYYFEKLIERLV